MFRTKKFIILTVCLFISILTVAQSIKVIKESARINGENTDGFAVDLEGNSSEVNSAFVKYLKKSGKVKQGSDYMTLSGATLNGKNYAFPIYALTKEQDKTAQVWLGIKAGEWPSNDAGNVSGQLEKMVYDFGVQYYRDKIQVQIDESNRALQAVERQQQRFSNQNRDLNTKLEDNKREKIQLEKSLENNKLEYGTLLVKIDKNKKDQDSVTVAGEQIKKVIEMQKVKQQKVN